LTTKTERFSGRVVLVTGAASGIGEATARRFVAEGANVVLTDKNAEALERVLASLPEDRLHVALHHDVTVEREWLQVIEEVEAQFGRLDVLINNAGGGGMRRIADSDFDWWRFIIALNLDSVFLGTKYAMPLLAKSGHGAVVNLSSIRGMVVGPASAAYSAAKAGVRLFTKAAAVECAEANNGVRVNSIHPGFVDTTFARAAGDDYFEELRQSIPVKRLAKPEEIAAGIAFLASDDASYMTGSELVIDGAFTAR
jgi:meso-butanediol dehydrogenase / (S,S)-butanediol dehydrogenase / diacetyl reductase